MNILDCVAKDSKAGHTMQGTLQKPPNTDNEETRDGIFTCTQTLNSTNQNLNENDHNSELNNDSLFQKRNEDEVIKAESNNFQLKNGKDYHLKDTASLSQNADTNKRPPAKTSSASRLRPRAKPRKPVSPRKVKPQNAVIKKEPRAGAGKLQSKKSKDKHDKMDTSQSGGGEKSYKCDICQKEFRQIGNLKQHRDTHVEGECHICKIVCNSKDELESHMKTHSGKAQHECCICKRPFTRTDNLREHMKVHTGEKQHKCDECGRTFTYASNLKSHMLLHSGKKPHECQYCNKSFRRPHHLKQHILTHTGEKPHACFKCEKSFSQAANLYAHLASQHALAPNGEPFSSSEDESADRKNNLFVAGGVAFNSVVQKMINNILRNPLKSDESAKSAEDHPNITFQFPMFPGADTSQHGYAFISVRKDIDQSKDVNEAEEKEDTTTTSEGKSKPGAKKQLRLFTCPICNKVFKKYANMIIHAEGHVHGECLACRLKFETAEALNLHLSTHTGESPYKCQECGTVCKDSHDLKDHMKNHESDLKHQCIECNRIFTYASNLKSHLLTHSGEKPFDCPKCTKSFRRSHHLKAHLRTHDAEKKHMCYICNVLFMDETSLIEHIAEQHKLGSNKEKEVVDHVGGALLQDQSERLIETPKKKGGKRPANSSEIVNPGLPDFNVVTSSTSVSSQSVMECSLTHSLQSIFPLNVTYTNAVDKNSMEPIHKKPKSDAHLVIPDNQQQSMFPSMTSSELQQIYSTVKATEPTDLVFQPQSNVQVTQTFPFPAQKSSIQAGQSSVPQHNIANIIDRQTPDSRHRQSPLCTASIQTNNKLNLQQSTCTAHETNGKTPEYLRVQQTPVEFAKPSLLPIEYSQNEQVPVEFFKGQQMFEQSVKVTPIADLSKAHLQVQTVIETSNSAGKPHESNYYIPETSSSSQISSVYYAPQSGYTEHKDSAAINITQATESLKLPSNFTYQFNPVSSESQRQHHSQYSVSALHQSSSNVDHGNFSLHHLNLSSQSVASSQTNISHTNFIKEENQKPSCIVSTPQIVKVSPLNQTSTGHFIENYIASTTVGNQNTSNIGQPAVHFSSSSSTNFACKNLVSNKSVHQKGLYQPFVTIENQKPQSVNTHLYQPASLVEKKSQIQLSLQNILQQSSGAFDNKRLNCSTSVNYPCTTSVGNQGYSGTQNLLYQPAFQSSTTPSSSNSAYNKEQPQKVLYQPALQASSNPVYKAQPLVYQSFPEANSLSLTQPTVSKSTSVTCTTHVLSRPFENSKVTKTVTRTSLNEVPLRAYGHISNSTEIRPYFCSSIDVKPANSATAFPFDNGNKPCAVGAPAFPVEMTPYASQTLEIKPISPSTSTTSVLSRIYDCTVPNNSVAMEIKPYEPLICSTALQNRNSSTDANLHTAFAASNIVSSVKPISYGKSSLTHTIDNQLNFTPKMHEHVSSTVAGDILPTMDILGSRNFDVRQVPSIFVQYPSIMQQLSNSSHTVNEKESKEGQ